MNREEYLKKLEKLINDLPGEDKEDILSDYEEHFIIGMENGRNEEEISKALGDPKALAKQIKVEHMIKKAEDKPSAGGMFDAVLAAAGLGVFNLVFILGPATLVIALIITLFVAGFILAFSGIATFITPLLQPIFPQYIPSNDVGIWGILTEMAKGLGLTVLGIALVVGMAYLSKWLYKIIIKYLKLNLRIISGRK